MSVRKITGLFLGACILFTSCSKNDVKPENANSISDVLSNSSEDSVYYSAKMIETNDNTVVGVWNDNVICYNGEWDYAAEYSDSRKNSDRYRMPGDFRVVSSIKENDERIYCYGFDSNHKYKITVFNSDLTQILDIYDESESVYCFTPDENRNIITCSIEDAVCFRRYSEIGELLTEKDVDLSLLVTDEYIFPCDITASENGNILCVYNNSNGYSIVIFNDNFEIIEKAEMEYNTGNYFLNNNNKIFVYEYQTEENVYNFYEINESDLVPEYINTLSGVDSIIPGTGKYDCFYYIADDLYGYMIEEDISESIECDGIAEHVFSADNDIKLIYSNDIYNESVCALNGDGEIRTISEISTSGYTSNERLSYNNHFQIVENTDDEYFINDIDLNTGENIRIVPKYKEDYLINNILLNDSSILLSYYDENSGMNGISIYDTDNFEENRIIDNTDLVISTVMNDGNYFLVCRDDVSESDYPVIVNSANNEVKKLSFNGFDEEDYIIDCSADSEKLYLLAYSGIYEGTQDNEEFNVKKMVDFSNISVPDVNSLRKLYADNGNIYIATDSKLYKLNPSDKPIETEKTKLKIYCINTEPDNAVSDLFTEKYPEYELVYERNNQDDTSDQINLQILSDDAPDIIMVSENSITDFNINRDNNKNAYVDLYRLIDSDPETKRSDYLENILKAMEYDGHLYQITPNFSIKTILADEKMFPYSDNWSISDLSEFLSEHSNDAFYRNDKDRVLKTALNLNMFYNEKGVFFDNSGFKNLMEAVKAFPEESDITDDFILYGAELSDFGELNEIKYSYYNGRNISNIGYPEIEGNGTMIMPGIQLSILQSSSETDAAWNYIKLYLSEEYMSGLQESSFSVCNKLMDKYMSQTLKSGEDHISSDLRKNEVIVKAPDEKTVNCVKDIVYNAEYIYRPNQRIENIFYEDYFEYMNGTINADDYAKKIQDKMNIYLNERY